MSVENAWLIADDVIDSDLATAGFNAQERYPEYGHESLREAWREGYGTALARWEAEQRDKILIDPELLQGLVDLSRQVVRLYENAPGDLWTAEQHNAVAAYDSGRALLAAAEQTKGGQSDGG